MLRFHGMRVRAAVGLYVLFVTVILSSPLTAVADEGVISGVTASVTGATISRTWVIKCDDPAQ